MRQDGPLAITVRLFAGDVAALGPGRADVLEAIAREGSISAAGRSLGMSYRFTWSLVDSMNGAFRQPLVEAAPGGRRGGGAALTPTGERVLAAYRALQERLAACAEGEALQDLRGLLRSGAEAEGA